MDEKIVRRVRVVQTEISGSSEDLDDVEAPLPEVEAPSHGFAENHGSPSRILRWYSIGRFCLFAAAFLVPFFFLPATGSPVDTNKLIVTGALMLLALVSFFACVIEKRKIEYPKTLLSLAVFSFVLITGISTYFSIARTQSFYGYLRQPDSFMSIGVCVLAFFLSFYFLRKSDIKKLGTLVLTSFIFATIASLFQSFGIFIFPWDFARIASFNVVGSVFAWGMCMAVIVACVATTDFRTLSPRAKQLLIAVAILMALGLVALNYQFLWLALTVITIIVASVRFVSREHFRIPLAIVVVALFFALVGSHFPSFVKAPTEIRPGVAPTLSAALSSLKGFQFLTGTGPATFNMDFTKYRPLALNQTNFWNLPFFQGYSYVLTLIATGGILGVLAFLFVLIAAARYLMDYREHQYAAMLLTGILFLFVSLFFYTAFFAELFLIFLGLGLIMPDGARREVSMEGSSRWKAFLMFIIVLMFIAGSLTAAYHVGQKYVAALDYTRANSLLSAGKEDAGLTLLTSALALDTQSDEYLRAASQVFVALAGRAIQAGGQNMAVQVQSNVVRAVQAAQNAVIINPNDVNNVVNLAGVYESVIPIANGADVMANGWYQKAINLDPADPQIPVFMARADIAAGDKLAQDSLQSTLQDQKYSDAEAMLKKSIDLKSDYAVPRFLLAQLYIKEGNVSQAIQRVEEIKAADPFDAGLEFQLGLLYYQNNQMEKAQGEFERAVGLDPNYSNARYFLGLIYSKKGMVSQAIDQFQKISVLNPDNAEVKTIIANLQAGRSALQSVAPPAAPPEKRNDVPVPDKPKK